jgi:hypothetical protein
LQFQFAYKRLLIRHEIRELENGNTLFDGNDILHISSKKTAHHDPLTGEEELVVSPFDHDYMSTAWKLSPFVENVVEYISGFVVYKIRKLLTCDVCLNELQEMNNEMPVFMKLKNRGTYQNPSKGVIKICKEAEKIIRQYSNKFMNAADYFRFDTKSTWFGAINI